MTFDRFDICQAYQQLESDYNVGGILWERPSNQRRMESIGVQLSRIQFSSGMRWVDIVTDYDERDVDEDNVRDIYLTKVLEWGLPIDEEMTAFMRKFYVPEFLSKYPQLQGVAA